MSLSTPVPTRIEPRITDLGDGMLVRRTLPSRLQRTVGAWCFLDHAGPLDMQAHGGMHVGQHPHIGLQTFTWMLSGEVLHRDSLGSEQVIRPGQINLMTAGRGIAHTEDSIEDSVVSTENPAEPLHLAQLWIALPPHLQDMEPAFAHYDNLPRWTDTAADGSAVQYTLLVGQYAGYQAPTQVYSPLLAMDVVVPAAHTVQLHLQPGFEYALQALEGSFSVAGEPYEADTLAYWPADDNAAERQLTVVVQAGSRLLLLGGEPLPQKPTMWWNFVAYDKERIMQAQQDWQAGADRFGVVSAGNKGGEGDAPRIPAPAMPWR